MAESRALSDFFNEEAEAEVAPAPEETVTAEVNEPEEASASVVLVPADEFDTGDERVARVSTPGCEGEIEVSDEPTKVDAPCARALKAVPQVEVTV